MKQLLVYHSHGGVLNAFEGECCFTTDTGPWVYDLQHGGMCLPGTIHKKWQIRQREWTYRDVWPMCSARTLWIANDRHTAQNSFRDNGIIRMWRNLMKNGIIKPRERQECGWASGTVKPWVQTHHHSSSISCTNCLFSYSFLPLQMGFGYTAKNMAPDNS